MLSGVTMPLVTIRQRRCGDGYDANLGGHLKTGQSGSLQNRPVERAQDSHSFTPSVTLSARVFRVESLFGANSVYTDITWGEDGATRGAAPTAAPAAEVAGRRKPPQREQPFWRESGKSQGFG